MPQNLDFATGRAAVHSEQTFLRDVFAWMFAALALSTGIAVWFHADHTFSQTYFQNHEGLFLVAIFAQIGLAIAIQGAINRISARTAAVLFFLYAGLTGVVFSVILTEFTAGTVVGAFAGAGQSGIFREKAVARMDGLGARALGHTEDLVHPKVRLGSWRRADGIRFVGPRDVERGAIDVGINRDGGDTHFTARADDAHRDLSPVGDQNLLEH